MAQDLFNHQTFMVFKGNNVIIIHYGRKPVIEAIVSRLGCVMVDIEQPAENERWSGAIDIDYRDELPFVRLRSLPKDNGDDKSEVLPLKFEEGVKA